jgi:predicted nucleic acid-binding protein
LTISEVHKLKGGTELADAEDDSIIEFLRNSFIKIINNDRGIGEHANRLARQTGLTPNDAIHLASALYAGCDVLLVWDKRFGKVKYPGISIEEPRMMGQLKLMEVEKKKK